MSLNWILSPLIAEWIFQTFRGWISRYLHLSTYLPLPYLRQCNVNLKKNIYLTHKAAADVCLLLFSTQMRLSLIKCHNHQYFEEIFFGPTNIASPSALPLDLFYPPHSTLYDKIKYIVLNMLDFESFNILSMTENIVSPSASLMWWKWSGFNWPWSGEIELGPPQPCR